MKTRHVDLGLILGTPGMEGGMTKAAGGGGGGCLRKSGVKYERWSRFGGCYSRVTH